MWTPRSCPHGHRECSHGELEQWSTVPNAITALRTVVAVGLGLAAAVDQDLTLLLWATGVYWVGDTADGAVARLLGRENRIGAVFDIVCDRVCAAVVYMGVVWLLPHMVLPVAVYLLSFSVVDLMLSLAFLAYPLSSPNYFYLADAPIYRWNWSKPAKAANSAIFLVLLLLTESVVLTTAIAGVLLVAKLLSLRRLSRLPPAPDTDCAHELSRSPAGPETR
ncbi:MAG: CDP-alcohol phosphatidyltransferase family protein [Ornithinimicrobium sp.]|uniref:CDP-alcohol phosphatidyltransferase family protein n=1 Tax=Ornithinimicrobium sp. TaxID=1977084 RepID=UPI0018395905|nr:CDP-alcohol phosphatidyltransferase family protein [Actinomycetota bacterium]